MDDALPRTFVEGFLSGLGHPIIGVDHAAFIIAAGFFLALFARGLWGILALIAGSLAGAALHLGGIDLPGAEAGVAVSVILIGGLVIARRRIPFGWLIGGLAVAGALHGHAYAESIFGAEVTPLFAYVLGFSVLQLGLAAGALLFHRWLMRDPREVAVSAVLGGAAGGVGVFFLLFV